MQLSADAHKQIAQLVGTLRPYVAGFSLYPFFAKRPIDRNEQIHCSNSVVQ